MQPAWSDPAAAAGAAVLAGVVAVGADITAGGEASHTVTLGLLALVLGVLRLRGSGRARSADAAATVALLSQPVLHAITTLVPVVPRDLGTAFDTHALADAPVTMAQLSLAAVIVLSVASIEPLLRRCFRWRPGPVLRPFSGRTRDTTPPPALGLDHRRARREIGHRRRLRAPPVALVAS